MPNYDPIGGRFDHYVIHVPSDKGITGTAAVNTALTLTLPAPAAGKRLYLTRLKVTKLYSVVGVAAGAGVLITSNGLPGNPIWTTEQLAAVAGTAVNVIDETYAGGLKCTAVATQIDIIMPQQLQTIWRATAWYFELQEV